MANQRITSLGVVVARVQVDDLHEGHVDLFQEVSDTNTALLVVLGLSPCKCTSNNPLDYDTRRRMVVNHFPSAKVAYITDMYSDIEWSKTLDAIVAKYANNFDTVTLYGGRDSFIKYYHGKYKTQELTPRVYVSGTAIRTQLAIRSRDTVDFRAGAIWYALNQYPRALPTVDIAVLDIARDSILLARKPHEDRYRLIGGFAQPGESYEVSASRELQEEAGLIVEPDLLNIERSFFIDDWRYKNERDKITTMLYSATEWSGTPKPDDDIHELQWFTLSDITKDILMPNHVQMVGYLMKKYAKSLTSSQA